MLHSLTMKNWHKHSNRTFVFADGLNMIRGENEAGKSLIMEAIDYALHGSTALRLPASMYPPTLTSILETTIRGTRYRIDRSPKMAVLIDLSTDMVIAKGTKPVDAEIRKLLGFSRSVFLVSNYSSQDSINQLSTLKPAERKKVIDNVIGLTAVEEVLAEHKQELSSLNKLLASHASTLPDVPPVEPEQELPFFGLPDAERAAKYLSEKITSLTQAIATQKTIKETRENLLANKPKVEVFDFERLKSMLIQSGPTSEEVAARDSTLASKKQTLQSLLKSLESEVEPTVVVEPSRTGLIPNMTRERVTAHNNAVELLRKRIDSTNAQVTALRVLQNTNKCYSQEELEEIQAAEKLYQDWQHVQSLKEKGSLTCDDCGAEIHLMKEHLKQYQHVPELVNKPEVGFNFALDSTKTFKRLTDEIAKFIETETELEQELEEVQTNWFTEDEITAHFEMVRLVETYDHFTKMEADYNYRVGSIKANITTLEQEISGLESNWFTSNELNDHFFALEQLALHDNQERQLRNWQTQLDSIAEYQGDDIVCGFETSLENFRREQEAFQKLQQDWFIYNQAKRSYDNTYEAFSAVKAQVDSEKNIIETLQLYKAKIKTSILPSVNAVASSWVQRMSQGKHASVALTDDMEILVNGAPIEALSISGRALGHLSLRMALGQVLTNSIYPVFMADEVDASMRNDRAQSVLDNLVQMLNGSVKQIIMISHRELENIQNVIEV